MSTDCVFSGEKGNYLESDFPDGKTFYDRTKALGELNDDKNITLRNSIVGPDIKASGIGLLSWFMKQSGTINGFTKAMWTGQTTVQLAKTMEYVAKERMGGLYNAVPHNSISKYELLKLFNKYLRDNSVTINPDVYKRQLDRLFDHRSNQILINPQFFILINAKSMFRKRQSVMDINSLWQFTKWNIRIL